jgi:cell division protein ZapB
MTFTGNYRTDRGCRVQGRSKLPEMGVDRTPQPHYIESMSKNTESSIVDQEITRLEEQVEILLHTVERLTKENRSLRAQQESLSTERATLIERHDLVRNRVEAIVTRLRSLETGV